MFSAYYNQKTLLITGTSGFLGKVILEKVLRTFPDVGRIYVSLRVKSGQEEAAYDRYKREIKDSPIFDALKKDLGMKAWRKLLKKKLRLLPMDL
jgi:nucleoside-diphosphate-sugar epimerase